MPLPLLDGPGRTRARTTTTVPAVAFELHCLDQVMRECRPIAAHASRGASTARPSSVEAVGAAVAVLGGDRSSDPAVVAQLVASGEALVAARDGLVALDPRTRLLLVSTSRALHRQPSLSGQRAVLAAIAARRSWEVDAADGLHAERLDVGLRLAGAVVAAAWSDCRDEVMTFRRVVSAGRRPSGPDPHLHVVAATITGSLSGALTCPPDVDPSTAAVALGLATAVRQVTTAVLSAERSRPARG